MARQPQPAGRSRPAFGVLVALVGTLAAPTAVLAEQPAAVAPLEAPALDEGVSTERTDPAALTVTPSSGDAASATPRAHRRALRVAVPILVLLAIATVLLLVELRRRRDERRAKRPQSPHRPVLAVSRGSDAPAEGLVAAGSRHGSSGVATAEVELGGASRLAVLANLVGELHEHDDAHSHAPHASHVDDGLDTTTASMCCPECARCFEMGARFCPWDGELLHLAEHALRSVDDHDALEHVMVCPRCDAEYEPGAIYCAEDQARLLMRGSGDDEPIQLGTAPMVVCTGCAREFRVGQTSCPDCAEDSDLQLLHGRTTRGVWVDAPPFSRICPDCGARYSDKLGFCSHDGTELVHLN